MDSKIIYTEKINLVEKNTSKPYFTIQYETSPLEIKTEWLNMYYSQEYKTVSIKVNNEEMKPLVDVLKFIDAMVEAKCPPNVKYSHILKESGDSFYIKPQTKYSKIYDEKKQPQPQYALQKNQLCRVVLGFGKSYNINGYFGLKVIVKQIQIKPYIIEEPCCLFD